MGGNSDDDGPNIEIKLELHLPPKSLNTVTEMLLPDYIDGTMAGSLGSISLQNADIRSVAVTQISSTNVSNLISFDGALLLKFRTEFVSHYWNLAAEL